MLQCFDCTLFSLHFVAVVWLARATVHHQPEQPEDRTCADLWSTGFEELRESGAGLLAL